MKQINILGTAYDLIFVGKGENKVIDKGDCDGYCDTSVKKLYVSQMNPSEEIGEKENLQAYKKQVIRHEIIHAFFHESGLDSSAIHLDGAWPANEEMVDWIAIQFPKLLMAFEQAECL